MLDLYHSCKIFQITQIYEYELGKFMYKIVHNSFPSFISNCYSHINERHNYPTRIATNNNLTTTSSKKIFNTKIYTIHRTKPLEQYSQRLKKQIIPSLMSSIQKIFTGSSCVVMHLSIGKYLFKFLLVCSSSV